MAVKYNPATMMYEDDPDATMASMLGPIAQAPAPVTQAPAPVTQAPAPVTQAPAPVATTIKPTTGADAEGDRLGSDQIYKTQQSVIRNAQLDATEGGTPLPVIGADAGGDRIGSAQKYQAQQAAIAAARAAALPPPTGADAAGDRAVASTSREDYLNANASKIASAQLASRGIVPGANNPAAGQTTSPGQQGMIDFTRDVVTSTAPGQTQADASRLAQLLLTNPSEAFKLSGIDIPAFVRAGSDRINLANSQALGNMKTQLAGTANAGETQANLADYAIKAAQSGAMDIANLEPQAIDKALANIGQMLTAGNATAGQEESGYSTNVNAAATAVGSGEGAENRALDLTKLKTTEDWQTATNATQQKYDLAKANNDEANQEKYGTLLSSLKVGEMMTQFGIDKGMAQINGDIATALSSQNFNQANTLQMGAEAWQTSENELSRSLETAGQQLQKYGIDLSAIESGVVNGTISADDAFSYLSQIGKEHGLTFTPPDTSYTATMKELTDKYSAEKDTWKLSNPDGTDADFASYYNTAHYGSSTDQAAAQKIIDTNDISGHDFTGIDDPVYKSLLLKLPDRSMTTPDQYKAFQSAIDAGTPVVANIGGQVVKIDSFEKTVDGKAYFKSIDPLTGGTEYVEFSYANGKNTATVVGEIPASTVTPIPNIIPMQNTRRLNG